uniref:Uncharacterized protein n=1 Tax=Neogobius melanostomus TaxID=47308 RepID=A0A8C6UNV6_9GOBI
SLMLELNSQLNQLPKREPCPSQLLSEARREVCRKERSLRILGKHLCVVQKERRRLEQRLQEAEGGLQTNAKYDATPTANHSVTLWRANGIVQIRPAGPTLGTPDLHSHRSVDEKTFDKRAEKTHSTLFPISLHLKKKCFP